MKATDTRKRTNWKARAIALETELNACKAWAIKIDDWHTELCRLLGVDPVYPGAAARDSQ